MPLRYLGQKGSLLPELLEEEWTHIFDFFEFYVVTENINHASDYNEISVDWKKLKDVLRLLGKMT